MTPRIACSPSPYCSGQVVHMQKAVRDAARISLEELLVKKLEAERGMKLVDDEITWHDEQRLRGGDATEEDQFPEVFTDFYNWAAEQKDIFDEELAKAQALFKQAAELMGEPVKEPTDLFDVLEKFIRRFDTAAKEFDEEKRAAEEQQRRTDAPLKTDAQVAKKTLRSGHRNSLVPGIAQKKISIRSKAQPPPPSPAGAAAGAAAGATTTPNAGAAAVAEEDEVNQMSEQRKKRMSNAPGLDMASRITTAGQEAGKAKVGGGFLKALTAKGKASLSGDLPFTTNM